MYATAIAGIESVIIKSGLTFTELPIFQRPQ